MKSFLLGVMATILATVCGYLAIEGIKLLNGADREVRLTEFTTRLILSEEQVAQWQGQLPSSDAEALNSPNRLTATAIVVENTGTEAIRDQRLVVRPTMETDFSAGILDFQNDSVPGIIDEDTVMSVNGKTLTIDYQLLTVGEIHRFWLIHDGYSDLEFVMRDSDLNVRKWNARIYLAEQREDRTAEIILAALFIAISAFVIGVITTDRYFKKVIKRKGFDVKEFMLPSGEGVPAEDG